jgi:hypothetical protein
VKFYWNPASILTCENRIILSALAAILCSQAERMGDMHNEGWYWSLLSSFIEIQPAAQPVKDGQDFSI